MFVSRAHRSLVHAALLAVAGACGWAATAPGATGGTVVSVTVPSATTLDATACQTGSAATDFGIVQPGTGAVTSADCDVLFGSSNDTATLQVNQADTLGTAMWAAGSGLLDIDFNTTGMLVTDLPVAGDQDHARDAVVLADGSTVTVGHTDPATGYTQMVVTRVDVAGVPVASFDGDPTLPCYPCDGEVVIDPGGAFSQDRLGAVTVDDDGRLLAVGISGSDAFVLRLLPDGSFDDTFAGDGSVQVDFGPGYFDNGMRVASTSDGGIVVLADSSDAGYSAVGIIRLNADGSIDDTFDGDPSMPCHPCNGVVRWRYSTGATAQNRPLDLAVQDDDKVLVAMETSSSSAGVLARLTSTGVIDTSYSDDGLFFPTWPNLQYGNLRSVLVDEDGRVYGFGSINDNGGQIAMVRTLATGAPDTAFGPNGVVEWDVSPATDEGARESVLADDGSIFLLLGRTGTADEDIHVARIFETGAPDTRFGTDGVAAVDVAHDEFADQFRLGADGELVVPARTRATAGSEWDMLVVRFGARAVSDFAGGSADWLAGSNMFGACLHSVADGATTGVGTWTTTGSCTTSNADPWRAIPIAPTSVARTGVAGDNDARARLRFGFRAAATQAPGRYVAPIRLQVVAPAV